MTITCPIIEHVPVNKYTTGSNTNISTNNHISDENPLSNDWFFALKIMSIKLQIIYCGLGGLSMMFGSAGLKLRAVAGKPSVTRLTQSN